MNIRKQSASIVFSLGQHAHLVFVLVGGLLVLFGFYHLLLPALEPDHWRAYTRDPGIVDYLAMNFRAMGLTEIALGVFAGGVALTAYRRRERWAWALFLVVPPFLGLHAANAWFGPALIPLVILTVAVVLASHPLFFSRE